ncbi:hypothetical protein Bca4012_044078 [Brassica carinata]
MKEIKRSDRFSRDDTEEFIEAWIHGRIPEWCRKPKKVDKADELDGGGDNKTVVWLEDIRALVVTRLRWQRKKTIMTSRIS